MTLQDREISRRHFMAGSLVALPAAGSRTKAGTDPFQSGEESKGPKIKEFRTLGRTGFRVSDIGFGSGELKEPSLLEAILNAGVNYIDAAESYTRGQVEEVIGTVLKRRDRRETFISSKIIMREDVTKSKIIEKTNACLERLQSDYVDCMMIHMPSTREQLNNSAYHDAILELKSQGKVKYSGLSNHGPQWNDVPETMEQVATAAAEDGRFDVMLFVYNYLQREQGERILKACREKNVGTTLMKTNPILNYLEWQDLADKDKAAGKEPSSFTKSVLPRLKERADAAETFKKKYNLTDFDQVRDAAVKFVLNNPNVNTACLTIKNFKDLQFYAALSGARFGSIEKRALEVYEQAMGQFYCRHACGLCESECPQRVPVNTIMRYIQYFQGQGREKRAMQKYASLRTSKADNCRNCDGYCERACPYGVPIQGLLALAHNTLTLA